MLLLIGALAATVVTIVATLLMCTVRYVNEPIPEDFSGNVIMFLLWLGTAVLWFGWGMSHG